MLPTQVSIVLEAALLAVFPSGVRFVEDENGASIFYAEGEERWIRVRAESPDCYEVRSPRGEGVNLKVLRNTWSRGAWMVMIDHVLNMVFQLRAARAMAMLTLDEPEPLVLSD